MKKLIKSLLAVFTLALVFGFAATTVEARVEDPLLIEVNTRHEITPNNFVTVRGMEIGLFRNGTMIESRVLTPGFADFGLGLTTADVPYLELRIINGNGYTSNDLVIPISSLELQRGWYSLFWNVFPGDAPAVQPTPTPAPPTPTPPPAADRILRFPIGSTTFTDNGASRTLEAAPFISGGRTMVPLRVIGEALGATDLALNRGVVSLVLDGRTITMTVGQPLPGNMGTPVIIAGRTFVPLAYIIEEMGATARWDSAARVAYIYIG